MEREITLTFYNTPKKNVLEAFNDVTMSSVAWWESKFQKMRSRIDVLKHTEIVDSKMVQTRIPLFGNLFVYKISEESPEIWPRTTPKKILMFMSRYVGPIKLPNGRPAILEISERYRLKMPLHYHNKLRYNEAILSNCRPPFITVAVEIEEDSDAGSAIDYLFGRLEGTWTVTLHSQYFKKGPHVYHMWPHEWNNIILPIAQATKPIQKLGTIAAADDPVVILRHKYDGTAGLLLEFEHFYAIITRGTNITIYNKDAKTSPLLWSRFDQDLAVWEALSNDKIVAVGYFETVVGDRQIHYYVPEDNSVVTSNFRTHQLALESWTGDLAPSLRLKPKPYWYPGQKPPPTAQHTDGFIVELWNTRPQALLYKIKPGIDCTIDGQMRAGGFVFAGPLPSAFIHARSGALHSLVRTSGCLGSQTLNEALGVGLVCELSLTPTLGLVVRKVRPDKTTPNSLAISARIALLSLVGNDFLDAVLSLKPFGYFKTSNQTSILRRTIRADLLTVIKGATPAGASVIEFGCGRGSMAMPILNQLSAYIGFDQDIGALIEWLSRLPRDHAKFSKTRLGLWCGSFTNMLAMHDLTQSVTAGSIDWIWFPHSIHYANGNFEAIYNTANMLLKPAGGILIIAYDYKRILQELETEEAVGTETHYIRFRKSKEENMIEVLTGFTGQGAEDWEKEPIFDFEQFAAKFEHYQCTQNSTFASKGDVLPDEHWVHDHMKYYIFKRSEGPK